jgi:hypothetical protein
MSKGTARVAAAGSSLIEAVIEQWNPMGPLSSAFMDKGVKTAFGEIASRTLAENLRRAGVDYLKELGEEGAQQFVADVFEQGGRLWQGLGADKSAIDIAKDSLRATIDAAGPMIFLMASGRVTETALAQAMPPQIGRTAVMQEAGARLVELGKKQADGVALTEKEQQELKVLQAGVEAKDEKAIADQYGLQVVNDRVPGEAAREIKTAEDAGKFVRDYPEAAEALANLPADKPPTRATWAQALQVKRDVRQPRDVERQQIVQWIQEARRGQLPGAVPSVGGAVEAGGQGTEGPPTSPGDQANQAVPAGPAEGTVQVGQKPPTQAAVPAPEGTISPGTVPGQGATPETADTRLETHLLALDRSTPIGRLSARVSTDLRRPARLREVTAESPHAKAIVRAMKQDGAKVRFFESDESLPVTGYFDPDNQTDFWVNVDSDYGLHTVATHEWSHWLEKNDSQAYDYFVRALMAAAPKAFAAAGKSYEEAIARHGAIALSEGELLQESVASLAEDVASDASFWEELAKGPPSIFRKIVDTISNIIRRLTGRGVVSSRMKKIQSLVAAARRLEAYHTQEKDDGILDQVDEKGRVQAEGKAKAQTRNVQGREEEVEQQEAMGRSALEREPWQMTREDFVGHRQKLIDEYRRLSAKHGGYPKSIGVPEVTEAFDAQENWGDADFHRSYVKSAVAQGKPVPPEVLKDYPELGGGGRSALRRFDRGERIIGEASLRPVEREAVKAFVKANNLNRAQTQEVVDRILESKKRFPTAENWYPLTAVKVVYDRKGNPQPVWKIIPYTFHQNPRTRKVYKATSPQAKRAREKRIEALAAQMEAEVQAIMQRAASGDVAAQHILDQRRWYSDMMLRLRQEFGGMADVFGDLLGALSPITNVKDNWDYAVEAIRRFVRNEYASQLTQFARYLDARAMAEARLEKSKKDARGLGITLKDLLAGTAEAANDAQQQAIDEYRAAQEARDAGVEYTGPRIMRSRDHVAKEGDTAESIVDKYVDVPTPNDVARLKAENPGKFDAEGRATAGDTIVVPLLYGTNSINAMTAMVNAWRRLKPGSAPKARNFSGNLIGIAPFATIDVWAARTLQRLAGQLRVPPPAEGGVTGVIGQDGRPTLGFGFGQDVYHAAAKKLGWADPDLQAMMWFAEKERWTNANWTNDRGEGGSFEEESSKMPLDRYVLGLSTQQSQTSSAQGKDVIPTPITQAQESSDLRTAAAANKDVLAYKVQTTMGRFATTEDGNRVDYDEISFDVEVSQVAGADAYWILAETAAIAARNNQSGAFVSRVLKPEEESDNARPGVEIYFNRPLPPGQFQKILNQFAAKMPSGFTFVADLRHPVDNMAMPSNFVGLRMQYVPEYAGVDVEDLRSTPGGWRSHMKPIRHILTDLADEIEKQDGVSYAKYVEYDTVTLNKATYGNYPRKHQGAVGGAPGHVWPGSSIRKKAAAAGRVGGAELREELGRPVPDSADRPQPSPDDAGRAALQRNPQVDTPQFKAWFRDSVVRDASGDPKVMYHGTGTFEPFEEFSPEKTAMGPHFGTHGQASGFHPSLGTMQQIAEHGDKPPSAYRMYPVYLSIQNPLRLRDPGGWNNATFWSQLVELGLVSNSYDTVASMAATMPQKTEPQRWQAVARKILEEAGYDGIVYINRHEGYKGGSWGERMDSMSVPDEEFKRLFPEAEDSYIAFRPEQIKSATGNSGEFDSTKPDIRRAVVRDRQIDTPEFKAWFEGSVVTHEDGTPKVLYHGTSKDVDFNTFRVGMRGTFLVEDPAVAGQYANENDSQKLEFDRGEYAKKNTASRVFPLYVRIRNPYIPTAAEMQELKNATNYAKLQREKFTFWRAHGHDGVKLPGGVWVVFSPNQMKSATGNDGGFDPAKADIRRAVTRQATSRPRANIGQTPGVRQLFDEFERKTPGGHGRTLVELDAEAARRLSADYGGERHRLLQIAGHGGVFDPIEARAYVQIMNREGLEAVASGHGEKLKELQILHEAWRATGTLASEAFYARQDPLNEPMEERAARKIVEAIVAPTQKSRKRSARMPSEAKQKELQQHLNNIEELKKELEVLGIPLNDVKKLRILLRDPRKAAQALNAIRRTKHDVWDRAYEYWRNAILSSPTTQSANLIGNFGHALWHFTAERLTEAMIGTVVRTEDRARMGEFTYLLGGILPGLSRASRNFFAAWADEKPVFEASLGLPGTVKYEDADTAIRGRVGRVVRWPQRLLLAVDEFSKSLFATMDAGAQAYRIAKREGKDGDDLRRRIAELVGDYSSEAWAKALSTAKTLAFQDQTSKGLKGLIALRQDVPGLRYLIPFITTPWNIFKLAIAKSPLGSASLAYRVAQASRTGDWTGISARVAQQVLAWGVVLLLMSSDDDDPWITGAADEMDPARQELARRTHPTQSIRIGDTWVSYSRLEPFATTISQTVDWLKGLRSGSPAAATAAPVQALMGAVADKTFISGLGDIVKVVQSEDPSKAATWASRFALSWIPNAFRAGGRASQAMIPERGVWGDGSEWAERLGRRTAQGLELRVLPDQPKVDLWGREILRPDFTGEAISDWAARLLIPTQLRPSDVFVGDQVLVNWNNQHPDERKFPQAPDRQWKDADGTQRSMTDEQYNRYATLAGEIARRIVEREVVLTPENPTERDLEVVTDAISSGRRIAMKALKSEWAGGPAANVSAQEVADAVADSHLVAQARTLSRQRPISITMEQRKAGKTLRGMQQEWEVEQADALEYLRSRRVSPSQIRQAWTRYVRENYSDPKTIRAANFALSRGLSRL